MLCSLLAAAGACRRQPAQAAAAPPQHVDSVIPREVEVARFRAGLERPSGLVNAAPTRDALVARYVRALEQSDTAALAGLAINRAEFAYLYYPTNPEAQPPYDLSPELMWFLMQEGSRKGLLRALEQTRRPLSANRLHVQRPAEPPGRDAAWTSCLVQQERLFGPILERDGRFKFVSFANKL